MINKKKGFTLVEIVIVIAVIAILSAVLIPTFIGIIDRAKNSTSSQSATSIRDQILSSDDEVSSIEDMKGYIIQYNDNFYLIGDNGELIDYGESLDDAMGNLEYFDGENYEEFSNTVIYKPTGNVFESMRELESGLYKNDELILSWQDLLNNDYVYIDYNEDDVDIVGLNIQDYYDNADLRLNIDQSVTRITCGVFDEQSINAIYFPNSVNSIHYEFFNGMTNLSRIYMERNNPNFYCDNKMVIYTKSNVLMAVKKAFGEKTDYVIKSSVRIDGEVYEISGVADSCFNSTNAFKTLTIPASIESSMSNSFVGSGFERFFVEEGNPYYLTDANGFVLYCQNTVLASALLSPVKDYIILKQININDTSYSVNTIYDDVFAGNRTLAKITIPESVNYIGNSAFKNCASLSKIVFLTDKNAELIIGDDAFSFYGDYQLRTTIYTEEEEVNPNIENAYYEGRIITFKIVLHTGIYSMEDVLLKEWDELIEANELTITDTTVSSLTYTSDEPYKFVMEAAIENIGNGAFENLTNLKEVIFNGAIYSVGNNAFKNSGLQTIDLPSTVSVIGTGAFEGTNISEFVLPNQITTISDNMLKNTKISQFNFSTVTAIGNNAFAGTMFTKVEIPANVQTIGQSAFSDIETLKTVKFTVDAENNLTIGQNAFFVDADEPLFTAVLVKTAGEIHSAISSYNWTTSNRDFHIEKMRPSGIWSLEGNLLYSWQECIENGYINFREEEESYYDEELGEDIYNITVDYSTINGLNYFRSECDIVIDDSVKNIEQLIYTWEHYVRNIYIPDSVESIALYAFEQDYYWENPITDYSVTISIANPNYFSDGTSVYSKDSLITVLHSYQNDSYAIKPTVSILGETYTITKIGTAFNRSYKIEHVFIPATITQIDVYTFNSSVMNEHLKSFEVENGNEYFVTDGTSLYNKFYNNETSKFEAQLFAVASRMELKKFTILKQVSINGNTYTVTHLSHNQILCWMYSLKEITIPNTLIINNDDNIQILTYSDQVEKITLEEGSNTLYCDNNIALYNEGKLITVAKRFENSINFKILDSYELNGNTVNVTGVSRLALLGANIKELTLSNNMTYLQSEELSYLYNLKSLIIPSTIERIGSSTLMSNSSLKTIEFIHSKLDNLEIEDNAICGTGSEITLIVHSDAKDLSKVNEQIVNYNWTGNNFSDVTYVFALNPGIYNTSDEKIISWAQLLNNELISVNSDNELNAFNYTNDENYKVVMPDTITAINSNVFKDNTQLTEITLPKQLNLIGANAFKNCENLSTIYNLEKVLAFGDNAFSGCTSLTDVDISGANVISNGLFDGVNLTNVKFSKTLTSIGSYAFQNSKLTEIIIPETVTTIGEGAFNNSDELTTIRFKHSAQNLLTIGTNAFYVENSTDTTVRCLTPKNSAIENYLWAESNRNVTYTKLFDSGLYDEDYNLVKSWQELKDIDAIYVRTENIWTYWDEETGDHYEDFVALNYNGYYQENYNGEYNFVIDDEVECFYYAYFSDMADIYFPQSIVQFNCDGYGLNAKKYFVDGETGMLYTDGLGLYFKNTLISFARKNNVEEYTVLGSTTISSDTYEITRIEGGVFAGMENLKRLILPATLMYIDGHSVSNSVNLEEFVLDSNNPYLYSDGKAIYGKGSILAFALNAVPNGTYTILDNVTINGENFDITIIGNFVFANATVKEVIIPETVEQMYTGAFERSNIEKAVIPASVNSIGEYSFQYCNNLKVVQFNHKQSDTLYINYQSFYLDEEAPLTIKVQDNPPQSILNYNYENDNRVVTFAPIKDPGLYNYTTQELIYTWDELIENNIVTVENGVVTNFNYNEDTLITIVFGNITTIGENVFKNNLKLMNVSFNKNITTIGNSAFEGCQNLAEVENTSSIKTIGNNAFKNCNFNSFNFALTETIGNYAFADNTAITVIKLKENVSSIGSYAFDNNTSLTDIGFYISNSTALTIGEKAFSVPTLTTTKFRSVSPRNSAVTSYDWAGSNRTLVESPLYESGVYTKDYNLIMTWQQLIDNNYLNINSGVLTGFNYYGSSEPINFVIDQSVSMIYQNLFDTGILFNEVVIPSTTTIYHMGWYSQTGCIVNKFIVDGNGGELYTDGYGLYYNKTLMMIARGDTRTSYELKDEYTVDGNTFKVENIDAYAFSSSSLQTVKISKYVKTISNSIFYNNSNIENVIVDDENEYFYFDGVALYSRDGIIATPTKYNDEYTTLSTVTIKGVTYDIKKLYSSAFFESNITKLTISEGISEMDNSVLCNMYNLTYLTLPSTLTQINSWFAHDCSSLTTIQFNHHNAILTIDESAFTNGFTIDTTILLNSEMYSYINEYNWANDNRNVTYKHIRTAGLYKANGEFLYSWDQIVVNNLIAVNGSELTKFNYTAQDCIFVMNDDITSIASNAFKDKTNLCEIEFSFNINSIGESAFEGCSKLNTVYLTNAITSIGKRAFYGCNLITDIKLPENDDYNTIQEYTFYGTSLEIIVIPSTITQIEQYAFGHVETIDRIKFNHYSSDDITIDDNAFFGNDLIQIIVSAYKQNGEIKNEIKDYEWEESNKEVEWDKIPEPGLYNKQTGELIYSWQELIDYGYIELENDGKIIGNFNFGSTSYGVHLVYADSVIYSNIFVSNNGNLKEITIGANTKTFNEVANGNELERVNVSPYNPYLYSDGYGVYDKTSLCVFLRSAKTDTYSIKSTVTILGRAYTITSVKGGAFESAYGIKNLTIPATITNFSPNNFGWCDNLQHFEVENGNTVLSTDGNTLYMKKEDYATIVAVSRKLKTYTMADTVVINGETLKVKSIEYNTFFRNEFTTVTLNGNLVYKLDWGEIFNQCNALSTITVAEGNTNIYVDGGKVVYADGKLLFITRDVTGSFKMLDEYTVNDTTIPVTEIVDIWEAHFTEFTPSLNMKNWYGYFSNNYQLKKFTVPSNIKQISSIGSNIENLNKIEFLHSQTDPLTISENAFSFNGQKLYIYVVALNYEGINPAIKNYDWDNLGREYEFIYMPPAGIYDSENELVKSWAEMLNENIVTVSDETITAFNYNAQSFKLVIDNSIKHISANVFTSNTNLTSVSLSRNIKTIGENAFKGCSSLLTVSNLDLVTQIGASAFEDCTSLTSIKLGKLNSINANTFKGCSSTTSVTIESSVTSIGEKAFYDCSNLTTIKFTHSSNDTITIAGDAFFVNSAEPVETIIKCILPAPSAVTSYDWESSNRSVSYEDLYEPGLYSVNSELIYTWDELVNGVDGNSPLITLTDDNKTIDYIDYWEPSILVIDSSITRINYNTFDTRKFTEIIIPSSVTYIEENTFNYLTNLTKFAIKGTGGVYYTDGIGLYKDGILFAIAASSEIESYEMIDSYTIGENTYNVTEINYYATACNSSLSNFKISKYVENFGSLFQNSNKNVNITVDSESEFFYSDGKALYKQNYLYYYFNKDVSQTSYTILDTVTINGTTYNVEYVNSNGFSGNQTLNELTISKYLQDINQETFNSNIETFNVHAENDYFYDDGRALYSRDSLIFYYDSDSALNSYTIPEQITIHGTSYEVTQIGQFAFIKNTTVTTLNISKNINSISAQLYSSKITSVTIDAQNNYFMTDGYAIYSQNECLWYYHNLPVNSYTVLGSVVINGTTYTIQHFYGYAIYQKDIKELVISEGFEYIGNWTIVECNIEKIVIPASVTNISDWAIVNCKIDTIQFNHTAEDTLELPYGYAFYNDDLRETTVYVQYSYPSSIDNYDWSSDNRNVTIKLEREFGMYDNNDELIYTWEQMISNNVVSVDGNNIITEFNYDAKLFNLYIPNTITGIGDNVFKNNLKLSSVKMTNAITSIGESAFEGCQNLLEIGLSRNINSIGSKAFMNCSSLSEITLPTGLTAISSYAFSETALTSISIPTNVTSIGDYAFDGSDLTIVSLNTSITSVGAYAFNSTNLTSVSLPESLTDIGTYTFANIETLTTISFKQTSATSLTIGANAFYVNTAEDIETTVTAYSPYNTAITGYAWSDSNRDVTMVEKLTSGLYNYETGDLIYTWQTMVENGWLYLYDSESGLCLNSINFYTDSSETKLSFVIDESVQVMSDIWVGGNNYNLYEFTIPASVKSINGYLMGNCPYIENINIDSDNKYYYTDGLGIYSKYGEFMYYATGSSNTSYVIKSTVTIGGTNYNITSMYNNQHNNYSSSNVTSIQIPDYVTELTSCFFDVFQNVTTFNAGNNNNIAFINDCLYVRNSTGATFVRTFNYSTTTIVVPETVTIGEDVLQVNYIASHAFNYGNVNDITIPKYAECHESVFDNSNLRNVTIDPENEYLVCINYTVYAKVNNHAKILRLLNNDALTNYVMPDTVTIGSDVLPVTEGTIFMFSYTSSLTNVTFNGQFILDDSNHYYFHTLSNIQSYSVAEWNGTNIYVDNHNAVYANGKLLTVKASISGQYEILSSYTLNGNTIDVTYLEQYAFTSTNGLTSIVIDKNVTELNYYVFHYGLDNLTDIYYTGSEEQFNSITWRENLTRIPSTCKIHYYYGWTEVERQNATCSADGYVIYERDSVQKTQTLEKLPHTYSDGHCSVCNAEIEPYDVSTSNDIERRIYKFNYDSESQTYSSTNQEVYDSNSIATILFYGDGLLSIYYTVESEEGCDPVSIFLNGVWLDEISGYQTKTYVFSNLIKRGDKVEIRYHKDGGMDIGSDTATFKINFTPYEVIEDVASTCSTRGYKKIRTGSDIVYEYKDLLPHTYEDGECTVCGHAYHDVDIDTYDNAINSKYKFDYDSETNKYTLKNKEDDNSTYVISFFINKKGRLGLILEGSTSSMIIECDEGNDVRSSMSLGEQYFEVEANTIFKIYVNVENADVSQYIELSYVFDEYEFIYHENATCLHPERTIYRYGSDYYDSFDGSCEGHQFEDGYCTVCGEPYSNLNYYTYDIPSYDIYAFEYDSENGYYNSTNNASDTISEIFFVANCDGYLEITYNYVNDENTTKYGNYMIYDDLTLGSGSGTSVNNNGTFYYDLVKGNVFRFTYSINYCDDNTENYVTLTVIFHEYVITEVSEGNCSIKTYDSYNRYKFVYDSETDYFTSTNADENDKVNKMELSYTNYGKVVIELNMFIDNSVSGSYFEIYVNDGFYYVYKNDLNSKNVYSFYVSGNYNDYICYHTGSVNETTGNYATVKITFYDAEVLSSEESNCAQRGYTVYQVGEEEITAYSNQQHFHSFDEYDVCNSCGVLLENMPDYEVFSYDNVFVKEYSFSYDSTNNVYVNTNQGVHSSTATMYVRFYKAGVLTINWTVDSEGNDNLSLEVDGCPDFNEAGEDLSGTVSGYNVSSSSVFIFRYYKDCSVNTATDTATVKLTFTPNE